MTLTRCYDENSKLKGGFMVATTPAAPRACTVAFLLSSKPDSSCLYGVNKQGSGKGHEEILTIISRSNTTYNVIDMAVKYAGVPKENRLRGQNL